MTAFSSYLSLPPSLSLSVCVWKALQLMYSTTLLAGSFTPHPPPLPPYLQHFAHCVLQTRDTPFSRRLCAEMRAIMYAAKSPAGYPEYFIVCVARSPSFPRRASPARAAHWWRGFSYLFIHLFVSFLYFLKSRESWLRPQLRSHE